MGYSIVNILGGLLIVTSTMVVVSKNIKHAISWYAVQSLVLVGLLATLGATTGAQELLMWAGSAFITKVVLVPYILNRAYKKMGEPSDASLKAGLKPAWAICIIAVEVAICFAVVTRRSACPRPRSQRLRSLLASLTSLWASPASFRSATS